MSGNEPRNYPRNEPVVQTGNETVVQTGNETVVLLPLKLTTSLQTGPPI